ncbi:MAG: hypothetical protein KDK28_22040, partial [Maritimibacter sp.]|nr:hypothetical protein [Maritimibacter sp.]
AEALGISAEDQAAVAARYEDRG